MLGGTRTAGRGGTPERVAVERPLGEERTVSRDGYISWGGARHGAPWPYVGSAVVVKERGELVEIWTGSGRGRIIVHARGDKGGSVMAPGQHAGIPLGSAARERDTLARRLIGTEVWRPTRLAHLPYRYGEIPIFGYLDFCRTAAK